MSFLCERCGACCRYHKCKHLTEDNLCDIYDKRPKRCRVDAMYEEIGAGMMQEEYYKVVKSACNLLRLKEWLDSTIASMYDKKYEQERVDFRRAE